MCVKTGRNPCCFASRVVVVRRCEGAFREKGRAWLSSHTSLSRPRVSLPLPPPSNVQYESVCVLRPRGVCLAALCTIASNALQCAACFLACRLINSMLCLLACRTTHATVLCVCASTSCVFFAAYTVLLVAIVGCLVSRAPAKWWKRS